MKKLQKPEFLIGLIFTIIGLITFLRNVRVGTFTFYRIGGFVNTGTIVLVLLIAAFMALIIKPNKFTKALVILSVVLLVVVIILSINITVARMSLLSLIIMLAMFFGGLALMAKASLQG